MSSINYIWEKTLTAINTLASGTGSFEKRLHDAYISALMRVESYDSTAEIADEINWVRAKCQHHQMGDEDQMTPISEFDRNLIVEKLLHVLLATTRIKSGRDST